MSAIEVLDARRRSDLGTGAARSLRRDGCVPCIIYGDGKNPLPVALERRLLEKYCLKSDFYSRVLELKVDNQNVMVLPKDVQYHPVTDAPLHADFLRVSKTSEIRVNVPIEFLNADKSPAIKLGAILNVVQRHVEVLCSPLSVPEKFEIDLAGAKMGATFTLEQLKLPEGCRFHRIAEKAVLANIVQAGGGDEPAATSAEESAGSAS